MREIETESYVPADGFFGAPYIDVDEERTSPSPHRFVHGGFAGTDTRFAYSFPPTDEWGGRMFQPLEGAHGGHEDTFTGPMGEFVGGYSMIVRLGGYMVESNQGHIGDEVDPKGGDDPGLYGHRASAEAGRFSKHVAAQLYGAEPHHAYVFGGSGGGRRSPGCLEHHPDVYDGALPYMGGGDVDDGTTNAHVKGAQTIAFSTMFNVQRLLEGEKMAAVVDAMAPGGTGNPYAGLDSHERDELAALYRQGYPRGDEFMIGEPMGQIWLWSSMADALIEQDPAYFERFWTTAGYVGHDLAQAVEGDLIDREVTVTRVLHAKDFLDRSTDLSAPQYDKIRGMARMVAGGLGVPIAIEVSEIGPGYRLGLGVRPTTGAAAGRQLYVTNFAGNVLYADGRGEANLRRFDGVEVGDQVHVDNHAFLAFCYFARHHVMDDAQFDSFRLDGVPIHEQHPVPDQSPLMGIPYSGRAEGKLLWVHHSHDASLWPSQGIIYEGAVKAFRGEAEAGEHFRIRWTDHAEHVPPTMLPANPARANSTWLIDSQPVIEQSLADLVDWVEQGVEPASTSYTYIDGKVVLPDSAAERGGIQPVVSLSVNGGERAEVRPGDAVELVATAELPPGAGGLVGIEWCFDGHGTFAPGEPFDGTATTLTSVVTHTFDEVGTWFPAVRVTSHRTGDVTATARRIPNLAQVRVVVS